MTAALRIEVNIILPGFSCHRYNINQRLASFRILLQKEPIPYFYPGKSADIFEG